MADSTNTQDQGTQGQVDQGSATEATVAKVYATRADAEANKPADASKALRPFEVSVGGASKGWVLARGHGNAIEQAARLDGYSASTGKAAAPVTVEAAAAKLATLTDAELAAMGLARKPVKGAKK